MQEWSEMVMKTGCLDVVLNQTRSHLALIH